MMSCGYGEHEKMEFEGRRSGGCWLPFARTKHETKQHSGRFPVRREVFVVVQNIL